MTASPSIRLYVDAPLAEGAALTLEEAQAHYLLHVMRCREGQEVALFNGRDGEWRAGIEQTAKKSVTLGCYRLLRPQRPSPDIWLLFAPLKHAPIDLLAQKATELGVSALCPVMTRHTAVSRVNEERLRRNAVEAAEQCERLDVPEIHPAVPLTEKLAVWPDGRRLLFGDESGASFPLDRALAQEKPGPLAVLVGPEGGFAQAELDLLRRLPYALGAGLGPRILRADTAAFAMLACLQARLGDWEERPAFRALA